MFSDRHTLANSVDQDQIHRPRRLIRVYIVSHSDNNYAHARRQLNEFVEEKYKVKSKGVTI